MTARLVALAPTHLLVALAVLGCGDNGGLTASGGLTSLTGLSGPSDDSFDDPAPTTAGAGSVTDSVGSADTGGTEGASGESGSASGESGVSGTGEGHKLDVGADTSGGGTTGDPEMACRKVDFLFIVDNSGSMADEQQNLVQNFPGFIATIQENLNLASDYHIMVIDTDAWVFAGCEELCPLLNQCPVAVEDYVCGVTVPETCEDVLGAGVVHPKGQDASGMDCGFASDLRYMDVTEPDLAATFACAATVGTGSTDDPEKPMQAMVAAVSSTGAAHDCNVGFLREDAFLVVTFLTDEDDDAADGSAGTVEGWKAALVAAKKGDEQALVVLGLFGDNDQPNGICTPFDPNASTGAEPSPRLRQFVESFGDHGIAGSVCAASYEPFFDGAIDLIDEACEDFDPR